jgi:hypothetical protein
MTKGSMECINFKSEVESSQRTIGQQETDMLNKEHE